VLQKKLRSMRMIKAKSVTSYLLKFTQTRDELAAVGEIVDPTVLVRTALNGFSKPWENFVRGIVARETMPSCERLSDDFMQEEFSHGSTYTSQLHNGDGEEDLALFAKGKKKTGQGPKGGAKQQQQPRRGEQKRDMSKVKCFACRKMGHYDGQCPYRKNKKKRGTTTTTNEEEFTAQIESECAFIVCC
jgi:hypothetical protein